MRTLALAVVLLAACNPKLDPITARRQAISASPLTPQVTWVVDKSGSMLTNVGVAPPCPNTIGGCGPGMPCPSNCPTRMTLLRQVFDSLQGQLDGGQHNLLTFPKDAACASETDFQASGGFDDIRAFISAVQPNGGTPTSASLEVVRSKLLGQTGVTQLLVLITDGLPNCNPDNATTCSSTPGCVCTTSACTPMNGLCALGCFDDQQTLNTANDLYADGIDLMVVPMGADVVDPLAQDFFGHLRSPISRTCSDASQCAASSSCDYDAGVCTGAQWAFGTFEEFAPAGQRIADEVHRRARCDWGLAAPETADRLEVTLGGANVPASQWLLRTSTTLRLTGPACDQLLGDVTLAPSVVEL